MTLGAIFRDQNPTRIKSESIQHFIGRIENQQINIDFSCFGFGCAGCHGLHCECLLGCRFCSRVGRATLVALHAWRLFLSLAASASGNTGHVDSSVERVRLVVLPLRHQFWGAVVCDAAVMGPCCLEGLENHEIHTTF